MTGECERPWREGFFACFRVLPRPPAPRPPAPRPTAPRPTAPRPTAPRPVFAAA